MTLLTQMSCDELLLQRNAIAALHADAHSRHSPQEAEELKHRLDDLLLILQHSCN